MHAIKRRTAAAQAAKPAQPARPASPAQPASHLTEVCLHLFFSLFFFLECPSSLFFALVLFRLNALCMYVGMDARDCEFVCLYARFY